MLSVPSQCLLLAGSQTSDYLGHTVGRDQGGDDCRYEKE